MATSRRYPIGCALSLVLGGLASQAFAEPPAASNDNGLMTFKNVRVVNTPPAATEQQPAAEAPSMRAFVNPAGELTEGTPDQARQLTSATAARARASIAANGAKTASTDDSAQLVYLPNNVVQLVLDETDMVSQKVRLDADGNLVQECVTGEDAAAHAAHVNAQPESQNDR